MNEKPKRIWAFHDGPMVGLFVSKKNFPDGPFVGEYIRADIAKIEALRSILSDDHLLEAIARGYDREDAAQKGEPDPWDIGDDDAWRNGGIACARAGLEWALAEMQKKANE